VDAASHDARADGLNEFMFSSGPARRVIATMSPECPNVLEVIPGGESGRPGSPNGTDQLALWLVNAYKPLPVCLSGVYQNAVQTVVLACGNGVVDPGEACDDGNVANGDCCSSACVFEPVATSCEDGNACTTLDVCNGSGTCVGGPAPNCDDGNLCTDDSCEPSSGCVYVDNVVPCDDGNACTMTDSCSGGACVGRDPVVCTALDQCHEAGVCDPGTGICSDPNSPDGKPCDDDNTCTTSDACLAGVCTGPNTALLEPNPRTNGYYKRLCHGPHSGDQLTAADAECVAEVAPATFGSVLTVADICAVLGPSQPNNDKCQQSEDDLMVLALNICKARVCDTQVIDSQCGSNTTVGQSLLETDAIFSDPGRNFDTCQHGKCLDEEINTGRALEMNSFMLTRAAGGGVTMTWQQPYINDGQSVNTYKVWRRPIGNSAFTKIATVEGLTYTDATPGDFEYEVTAVKN
jgi:cysteine-rich repeat protein